MTWKVEFLDAAMKAALDALPRDIRAKFERIVALVQSDRLERLREPYVRHLEGAVWETALRRAREVR
jgi:hypothetical protein